MIRGFLLLSIGVSLYASSEYVPISKFSQSEQVEHNFKKGEIKKLKVNPVEKETSKIIKKIEVSKAIIEADEKKKLLKRKNMNELFYILQD